MAKACDVYKKLSADIDVAKWQLQKNIDIGRELIEAIKPLSAEMDDAVRKTADLLMADTKVSCLDERRDALVNAEEKLLRTRDYVSSVRLEVDEENLKFAAAAEKEKTAKIMLDLLTETLSEGLEARRTQAEEKLAQAKERAVLTHKRLEIEAEKINRGIRGLFHRTPEYDESFHFIGLLWIKLADVAKRTESYTQQRAVVEKVQNEHDVAQASVENALDLLSAIEIDKNNQSSSRTRQIAKITEEWKSACKTHSSTLQKLDNGLIAIKSTEAMLQGITEYKDDISLNSLTALEGFAISKEGQAYAKSVGRSKSGKIVGSLFEKIAGLSVKLGKLEKELNSNETIVEKMRTDIEKLDDTIKTMKKRGWKKSNKSVSSVSIDNYIESNSPFNLVDLTVLVIADAALTNLFDTDFGTSSSYDSFSGGGFSSDF